MKLELLKRVSVVGTSCSGKTTFAKKLADILKIEHTELDAVYWLPDWVARPKDEFLELVETAASTDAWVLDGNYTRSREIVWQRATAIIWLDYSLPRTFYRSLNRTTRRILSGEEIFSGNHETFRQAFFSRDSILLWVMTSFFKNRRQYSELLRRNNSTEKRIFIFWHPRQTERFLDQIERLKP